MRARPESRQHKHPVDEHEYLIGSCSGIGVSKVSQLFFEQGMKTFGIGAGDLVRRMVRIGKGQFCGDVPTATES